MGKFGASCSRLSESVVVLLMLEVLLMLMGVCEVRVNVRGTAWA